MTRRSHPDSLGVRPEASSRNRTFSGIDSAAPGKSARLKRLGALVLAGTALLLSGFADSSFAQAYPNRPIRVIIPFPAGGMYNGIVRIVGDKLGPQLGQPIVIEHRPGAGGNLGAEVVARANPDGYTLGVLTRVQSVNSAYYRSVSYDLVRDFVPLAAIGEAPVVLIARSDAPFKDTRELIALAKAAPGKLNFGSATSDVIDLLRVRSGIDVTFIPYKGASDVIADIMAGRLDLSAGPTPVLGSLVKQNKARGIGIAGPRRIQALPEVPAIGEVIPGYDAGIWLGLFAPARTPAEIVERLRASLAPTLADADVRARLAAIGIEPGFSQATPAQITERIRAEIELAKKVVATTGTYVE